MNRKEILRMENITSYCREQGASKSGRLTLMEDDIVGIVGLNYSGKTALIGAIAGFAPYVAGVTYLYEKKVRITSIDQAKRMGVHCIRQSSSLIDEFTVEQNIQLQPMNSAGWLVHPSQSREYILGILDMFHMNIDCEELTGNLNQPERVLIEIAKAVMAGAKIIIFDNILHMFGGGEHSRLSELFHMLRSLGISLVLIDTGTRLLMDFCNRIYVMRRGHTVGVYKTDQVDEQTIIAIMLGNNLADTSKLSIGADLSINRARIMEWDRVHYRGILKGISFSVFENEVLGILNVNKNSGNAIREIIVGEGFQVNGAISFCGIDIKGMPYHKLMELGIAVLPEDDAVFPTFTVEENIELSVIKKYSGVAGRIKKNCMKFDMEQLLDAFMKKEGQLYLKEGMVPNDRLTYKRIMICRALMMQPKLMLMMHPTAKMDDIKMAEMSVSIRKICDFGCSVMVVSMDVGFLIGTCSRILVVNKGIVEADHIVNERTYKAILDEYGRHLTNL